MKFSKKDSIVKHHLRESGPYKILLREETLLEKIKKGSLLGFVQCDIEIPEKLRKSFANIPPIFQNFNVGRFDVGPLMIEYAEKGRLLTQPRRMSISSYFLSKEPPLHRCCSFIWIRCWYAERIVTLCNTLQGSVLITSFSLPLMLEERETSTQIQMLRLRR